VRKRRVYLVTGASGFVGRALCPKLRGTGRVRALFRSPAEGPWDESVRVDLSSGGSVGPALEAVDTVFHLAGKTDDSATGRPDAGDFRRVNTEGTARLLEASAAFGVSRFVYLSSVKAMGTGGGDRLNESAPERTTTPYGLSKREAEKLVIDAAGIPHVCVLRASPVYGAGSKGNLSRMISAMGRGFFPPVPRIHNARSMVHVDDLADALILASENEAADRRVFIVTDGRSYSTREIYEWVCESFGKRPPRWAIPEPVFRTAGRIGDAIGAVTGRPFLFNSGMAERLFGSAFYDSGLITRTLGFEPKRTLENALEEMTGHGLPA
jgi:nucleoside-diphosphate-sugar epimerase